MKERNCHRHVTQQPAATVPPQTPCASSAPLCSYVEQFDTLIPELTVEEMLMYTAELKRPRSESLEDKKDAVDRLVDK